MIQLSVIIPTCNNAKILEKTLFALDNQSVDRKMFEVIIINDGSTKEETENIQRINKKLKNNNLVFNLKHAGPATARNFGIKKAKGRIILLMNDDTIISSDYIKSHLKFHKRHPAEKQALLTFLTWYPDLKVTSFMYWLENGGPYFSFSKLESKTEVGWERFWTCGVSVKKSFLLKAGLFDEQFPFAAWEDIELGYRLNQEGLKLLYDKSIIAFHYHPVTISSIKKKMMVNGEMLVILKKKIPRDFCPPLARYSKLAMGLDSLFLPKPIFYILERLAFFSEERYSFPLLYTIVLLHYRIEGLRKADKKIP